MARDLSHRAAFEEQGETYVRVLAARTDQIGREAHAWLGEQQVKREEIAAQLRDSREEETLKLAKHANEIAERSAAAAEAANAVSAQSMKTAKISVAVSVVSVIVAIAAIFVSWRISNG